MHRMIYGLPQTKVFILQTLITKRSWWGKDHKQVQEVEGVYYLNPQGK